MKWLFTFLFAFISLFASAQVVQLNPVSGDPFGVNLSEVKFVADGDGIYEVRYSNALTTVKVSGSINDFYSSHCGAMALFLSSGDSILVNKDFVSRVFDAGGGQSVIITSRYRLSFQVDTPYSQVLASIADGCNRDNTLYITSFGDDATARPGDRGYPYESWDAAALDRTTENIYMNGDFNQGESLSGSLVVEAFPGSSITQTSASELLELSDNGSLHIIGKPDLSTYQINTPFNLFSFAPGADSIRLDLDVGILSNVVPSNSDYSRSILKYNMPVIWTDISIDEFNLNASGIDLTMMDDARANIEIDKFKWDLAGGDKAYAEYAVIIRSKSDTISDSRVDVSTREFIRNSDSNDKVGTYATGTDGLNYFDRSYIKTTVENYVSPDSITGALGEYGIHRIQGVYLNSTIETIVDRARGSYRSVFYTDFDGNAAGTHIGSNFIFKFGDIESIIGIVGKRPSSFRDPWDFNGSNIYISCDRCVVTADNVLDIDFVDPVASTNWETRVRGYYETTDVTQSVINADSDFILDGATLIVADTAVPAISSPVAITVTVRGCYYTNSLVTDLDVTLVYETNCIP